MKTLWEVILSVSFDREFDRFHFSLAYLSVQISKPNDTHQIRVELTVNPLCI